MKVRLLLRLSELRAAVLWRSEVVEVRGLCFERAEAVGLQRRLWDCFRTLEGEQGPVTHIQSSQCVSV